MLDDKLKQMISILPAAELVREAPDFKSWFAARMKGIGASDAAAVMGLSPYKGQVELWGEKTGKIKPADLSENEAVQWGIRLEPAVADAYEGKTGKRLIDLGRRTVITGRIAEFAIATLDRVIDVPENPGVLEIKTTGSERQSAWENGPPLQYQVQVQHQLMVTGLAWGEFAVLFGGQKFGIIRAERNEAFIALLLDKEAQFWDKVQRDIPPDPETVDGSESTTRAVKQLFPNDSGLEIVLPAGSDCWDSELSGLKEQIGGLEERKREVENRIRLSLGEATWGVTPSGVRFQSKTIYRKEYTVPESTYRELRRLKK